MPKPVKAREAQEKQAGSGRKARLTEQERGRIPALAKQAPPGHLQTQADGTVVARDEEGSAQWTLNAASPGRQTSRDPGQTQPDPAHLPVRRSALASHPQLGRPFRSGVCPQSGQRPSATPPSRPQGSTTVCTDETLASSVMYLPPGAWLAEHPRLQQVFIPTAAWLPQPARGLVAALSTRFPGGSELCQSRRD